MILRYHPERFKLTRPYVKQVVNYFRNNVFDGTPSLEQLQDVAGIMRRSYNEALSDLPYEQRPADFQLFSKETLYALHYAAFAFHGRKRISDRDL